MKSEYWPTQQWRNADTEFEDKFAALEQSITTDYQNINGIVVVRSGRIVFENYCQGHTPQDTHHVASVTKSVVSALIGIAIEAGYIESVEQKVLSFFPEYVSAADDLQKRTITIKHLLTMTAPIASKSTSRHGNEALDRLRRQRDWISYVLKQLGRGGRLGEFQYSTAGAHLLSAIITRTTGMSAREFANRRLFQPIGMAEIPDHEMNSFQLDDVFGKNLSGWLKDPQGNTTGGWGLTLTPRDMARFGYLYLKRGYWEGRQIISEKWIEQSLAQNANNYGYLWWTKNVDGCFSFAALGSGGNMICCLPKKDLVVAVTSKIMRKPQDPWQLIERDILPVFKS